MNTTLKVSTGTSQFASQAHAANRAAKRDRTDALSITGITMERPATAAGCRPVT